MKRLRWLLSITLLGLFVACEKEEAPSFSYLALGDSYTIGEGVAENERWPVQLAKRLSEQGNTERTPRIIARTGWRTSALLHALYVVANPVQVYMVSLLIGVNNQVAGQSPETFEPQLEELLNRAIGRARGRNVRVFVLSIPDWGVTAFGKVFGGERISREIDAYNAVCERICAQYNVRYFNITPNSRLAESDPDLLAPDNLHPSGIMYRQWVDLIESEVKGLLEN